MSKNQSGDPVEWVCGLDPDPTRDPKGLNRSFIVIWMHDGDLINAEVIEPTLTPARLLKSFLRTTRDPKAGDPHVPDRVRVASPEIAEMLGACVDLDVEIVAAPTPEFDALQKQVEDDGRWDDQHPASGDAYLHSGAHRGSVDRFFSFSARLYRAAPWEHVPSDGCLIGVTCERLGLVDAVLSVGGQEEPAKGIVLFFSYQDRVDYLTSLDDPNDPLESPPHMALVYQRGADVDAEHRKEISIHGFEVADAHAYPLLLVVGEDRLPRFANDDDYELAAAVADGLAGLCQMKTNLREGWSGKGSIVTFVVQTARGKLEMTLAVPHNAAEALREGRVKEVRRWEKKKP